MRTDQLTEHTRQEIIRLCHSGLDSKALRLELLRRLRTVVPFDYVYFSTTDPATQLVTNVVTVEDPPAWVMHVFLENEFLQEDFLKFRSMMKKNQAVGALSEATRHKLHRSPRYQAMLAPLGMGDELRAIFVTDAACWAVMCLHREQSRFDYTPAEAAFLSGLTPHIADGLRKALLFDGVAPAAAPDGPGVLILADDLSIVATTSASEYWLAELAETRQGKHGLPAPVVTVVGSLQAVERGMLEPAFTPKLRLRTRSGQWLVLVASRLRNSSGEGQITVIFEIAQPSEISPLIMAAYDLTRREGEITQCVLLGLSTAEIAARLHISPNTVQDHLKAIFEKVSVNSRGELAGRIFVQQHQPRLGDPLDASGQFGSSARSPTSPH